MLDRIANAISELEREKGDAFDIGDVMARKIARAALMAMREPTEAMTDMAEAKGYIADYEMCPAKAWTAMIDAIIADAPPCSSAPE